VSPYVTTIHNQPIGPPRTPAPQFVSAIVAAPPAAIGWSADTHDRSGWALPERGAGRTHAIARTMPGVPVFRTCTVMLPPTVIGEDTDATRTTGVVTTGAGSVALLQAARETVRAIRDIRILKRRGRENRALTVDCCGDIFTGEDESCVQKIRGEIVSYSSCRCGGPHFAVSRYARYSV
jgi:hypothetical protein